jgi:hypothetical protein
MLQSDCGIIVPFTYVSCIISSHTHTLNYKGKRLYEVMVVGRTPDISKYLDYHWYQNTWYYDQEAQFPEECRKLGKWIGVAHRVGQALCYYILPASARPIIQSMVQALTDDEMRLENVNEQITALDLSIHDTISRDGNLVINIPRELTDEDDDIYNPMEPEADKPEIEDFMPEMYDNLINAEVLLSKGDILLPAKVIGRKRDSSGNPIGIANANPILDTRIYNVEFPNGHTKSYAANI